MKTIIVAPHPDDESLGAAGTLLRRKSEGGEIAWLIATSISTKTGWSAEKVDSRKREIAEVATHLGFDKVYQLDFPATMLDRVPMGDLVAAVSSTFSDFQPNEVLLPHLSDVHTDHQVMFKAVVSCTKWFRYPSINRVMAYETPSETDFSIGGVDQFRPNVFVDISPFLESKLHAMSIYASELGEFPFPRSHEVIRALASLRGSASGFRAAEAFELLKERV
jgi:LmbE family N-acetylglucosaminyl deacetylase